MKKTVSLVLVLIVLFSCVSCIKVSYPCSFEFYSQEEFANIMGTKVDEYDKNWDFHLYKWKDVEPTDMAILGRVKGSGRKNKVFFEGLSMTLSRQDEIYGNISIRVYIDLESISDFTKEISVDYLIGGYALEFWDNTSSANEVDYDAYYITDTYTVRFHQTVEDATSLKEKGYTVDNFLSYLPEILEGKYSLSL